MHTILHLLKLADSGGNMSMPSKELIAFPFSYLCLFLTMQVFVNYVLSPFFFFSFSVLSIKKYSCNLLLTI